MVFYSEEEIRIYDQWYESWCDTSSGTIPKKTMTEILRSTGLPDEVLAEIWDRAAPQRKDAHFERTHFLLTMKLIGLLQHGISLNDIDRVGHYPLALLNRSPPSRATRRQESSLNPTITVDQEEEEDRDLFDHYLRKQGKRMEQHLALLDRSPCMEYLQNSQLPRDDIELIWDSVDIGNKEALTREEFQMMVHLVKKRQQGLKIGPETVSDWRLDQLRSRRKQQQQGVSTSQRSPKLIDDRTTQRHGTIMKELQPILDQRAHRLEEQLKSSPGTSRRIEPGISSSSHDRKKDDTRNKDEDLDDVRKQTEDLMVMTKTIDWSLLSVKELEIMVGKFERLLERHQIVEDHLDRILIEQRNELEAYEKQRVLSLKSSKVDDTTRSSQLTSRKEGFEREIKRLGYELERFYTSHVDAHS